MFKLDDADVKDDLLKDAGTIFNNLKFNPATHVVSICLLYIIIDELRFSEKRGPKGKSTVFPGKIRSFKIASFSTALKAPKNVPVLICKGVLFVCLFELQDYQFFYLS